MAMVKKARIVKSPLSSCDRSYAFAHALDVAPRQQQKRNGPRPTPPPFISVRESPFRRRLRLSEWSSSSQSDWSAWAWGGRTARDASGVQCREYSASEFWSSAALSKRGGRL